MTKNGIILNNEMADFSIPGVTKIDGAGQPVVSRKIQSFYILLTEFEGHAGSYGPSFFPFDLWPQA